uniref:Cilia- and flagella-associated protein 44 n=1 Tax=Timema cristinae TaxID=61476 RepID=A0A7R9CPD5_TIMCR|nr:unnamed protein product [Timema cristinae]
MSGVIDEVLKGKLDGNDENSKMLENTIQGYEYVLETESRESNDYISKPFLSEKSTLKENILEFHHSFGYDCLKYFNLCVMDKCMLIFISGNLIHFYNTETKQLTFRRSAGGGGIGHIVKNPAFPHLAVGEKGKNPLVIVYEWPGLNIVCVLREGTEREYTHLNYSPDGYLLLSQGGEPDYMLTIWDWQKATVLLQGKSYSNNVINASFSRYVSGHLTTSGYGHIKFWKMAETFTGLKLKGALGRFGKTEICDIIGFLALPDEKVVSGCDWGNILLWEEGLIKAEICRRDRTPCHNAPITQFQYRKGELTTISMDGMIKIWNFETIDLADPPENDRTIGIEPMFEFEIGSSDDPASLMCLVKMADKDDDYFWYAQDANGVIWRVDLNMNYANEPPDKILVCHAGPVIDMSASPCGPHIATLGLDGRIFFYNYLKKKILMEKQFSSAGSCLLWLPLSVSITGNVIIAGFADGVIRVLVASLMEREKFDDARMDYVSIIQVTKPHTKPITALSINPRGSIVVCGSEDNTIFVYQILPKHEYVSLFPVGFVNVPSPVTHFNWKPTMPATALVSCRRGQLLELALPERQRSYTLVSFHLSHVERQQIEFHSVKSQIRREFKLLEIAKAKEKRRQKKKVELAQFRAEHPGIEVDEETFLEDTEPEPELEPLYFPPEPNPILYAVYLEPDLVWLSMGGYDAGYIYHFRLWQENPVRSIMVVGADDLEIHSYIYNWNKKYLILGMQDGRIRVQRVNPNDHSDMTDYWLYSMHDNTNGIINKICFSYDERYLFTCGVDGNIFSYTFNVSEEDYPKVQSIMPGTVSKGVPRDIVDDIIHSEGVYSLEESKLRVENDRKMRVTRERKQAVKELIDDLAKIYKDIVERNKALCQSQIIPHEDLELDSNISADLDRYLNTEMDIMENKLRFTVEKSKIGLSKVKKYFLDDLESITIKVHTCRSNNYVTTFRLKKLCPDFCEINELLTQKIIEAERKTLPKEPQISRLIGQTQKEKKIQTIESFIKGLNLNVFELKLNTKLHRLLERFYTKKLKMERRQHEWNTFRLEKPNENVNHPDDVVATQEAERTVGDYKLKAAPDYRVPPHMRMSTLKMYQHVLNARERLFNLKKEFNQQVLTARSMKVALIRKCKHLAESIYAIHREVPPRQMKEVPKLPTINEEVLFPEKAYEIKMNELKSMQKKREGKKDKRDILPVDSEHEMLGTKLSPDHTILTLPLKIFESKSLVSIQTLKHLSQEDDTPTTWEIELSKIRNSKKQFQQDEHIRDINESVKQFDEHIDFLINTKIEVEVKAKFLEIHLLKLEQELCILKDFEEAENEISERVDSNVNEKHDIHVHLTNTQSKIESRTRKVDTLLESERQIQVNFQETIADNKFADFLKKIFKKKYKEPRALNLDDSDEESTASDDTSTEEEDDVASIESGDIGPIKLDESECPEGCDRELYQTTFNLRDQRHKIEHDVTEEKREMEGLKKEFDTVSKRLKTVEVALKESQEELEAFQRKKQQKLNEVDCVVQINLDQIQNIDGERGFLHFKDTLIFSKKALTQIQARPKELERERRQLKEWHQLNRKHLHRLNSDCLNMQAEIARLNQEIKECMENKFGGVIELDVVEEALLRRLIADMKSHISDMKRDYQIHLKAKHYLVKEKQLSLSRAVQENTEKLILLTILEEEKNKLEAILRSQAYLKEHLPIDRELEQRQDLEKLEKIVNDQECHRERLKNEINQMKRRYRPPLPPIIAPTQTSGDMQSNKSVVFIKHYSQDSPHSTEGIKRYDLQYASTTSIDTRESINTTDTTSTVDEKEEVKDILQGVVNKLQTSRSNLEREDVEDSQQVIQSAIGEILEGTIMFVDKKAVGEIIYKLEALKQLADDKTLVKKVIDEAVHQVLDLLGD